MGLAPSSVLFWKGLALTLLVTVVGLIFFSFYTPWRRPLFENSDFEWGNLRHWSASGEAFLNQPTYDDNTVFRGRPAAFPQGDYWVGTFENHPRPLSEVGLFQGDGPMGELRSDEFVIQGEAITFLLGGGDGTERAGVSLWVNGQQVLTAVGNGQALDSEKMQRIRWDVSKWRGAKATLVIRDQSGENWGHVNVDDFIYD